MPPSTAMATKTNNVHQNDQSFHQCRTAEMIAAGTIDRAAASTLIPSVRLAWIKNRRNPLAPRAATVSNTPIKYGAALDFSLSPEQYFLRNRLASSSRSASYFARG